MEENLIETINVQSEGDIMDIYKIIENLRAVKSSLEKQHDELVDECRVAQDKLATVREITSESTSTNMKLQENLNFTTLKLDFLSDRMQSLENVCQGLREKIADLEDNVKGEHRQQLEDLNSLEAETEALKKSFKDAISFYSETNLKLKTENLEQEASSFLTKGDEFEKQLKKLDLELMDLKSSVVHPDPWEEAVPFELQNTIRKIFSNEQEHFRSAVEELQKRESKFLNASLGNIIETVEL